MAVENEVMDLIDEYNGIRLFTTWKKYEITLDTDLNKDFKMLQEDALELMEKYFEHFSMKTDNFNFLKYFPNEGVFLLPRFLVPKDVRPTGQDPIPLTVRMLVESAKAGRWLY